MATLPDVQHTQIDVLVLSIGALFGRKDLLSLPRTLECVESLVGERH